MTARDDAVAAGKAASGILTSAERSIIAAMTSAASKVITGSLTAQMATRNVSAATSAELGAASARLQAVYSRAAEQATGQAGPLPDAPGQVATAVLRAQQDAGVAFGAVLAAAGAQGSRMPPPSSAYRRIVTKAARQATPGQRAQSALDAIQARSLTGWTSYAGRRYPLAAYGSKVVKSATVKLARMPAMSEITARRDTLLAAHTRAVAAAWDQAVSGMDARSVVAVYRGDSRMASATQDPAVAKRWRAEAAAAAATAWAGSVSRSPALTAALEDLAADGMAEGQADAMLLAAYSQKVAGFSAAAAFASARSQLQGDTSAARQAQDSAARMTAAAAAAVARALAAARAGASDKELAEEAESALRGGTIPGRGAERALWAAFGAGALALYRRVAAGQFTGQGPMIAWLDSASACPLCQRNAAGGPYAPADVPPYPGHGNCRCILASDTDIPLSMLRGALSGLV
jgi:hypothetical protein